MRTRFYAALFLILGSLPAFSAKAGQFVYPSMYSEFSIVQGIGITVEEAVRDAESAIPDGYVRELKKSAGQTISCTVSDLELLRTEGEQCDAAIPGNKVIITFAVVHP